MLKAIFFVVKIAVIVAAFIWLSHRPGTLDIKWLGYDITLDIGFALVVCLGFIIALLLVHRAYLWVAGLPRRIGAAKQARIEKKGQRSLMLGLTALSAGDAKLASYHAYQTRKYLPDDRNLSVLLEAQAANLNGDLSQSRKSYTALLENKDLAFLGLRGLMTQALENGQYEAALDYAYKAQSMHPKQLWILQMVYRLEIAQSLWDKAEATNYRLLRMTSRTDRETAKRLQKDHIAFLVRKADVHLQDGSKRKAETLLKKAHKIDPLYIPATLRLADYLIKAKKTRQARKIIEAQWKQAPHPDLIPLWDKLAPKNKAGDSMVRLRWFEKLIDLNRDHAESFMAAAEAAIPESLWGEAEQFLDKAESLRKTARLYRLYSKLAEARGQSENARYWMEQAANAPADKVWTCSKTGRIYESWSPLAQPHGSFNTIVWDYVSAQLQNVLGRPDDLSHDDVQPFDSPDDLLKIEG